MEDLKEFISYYGGLFVLLTVLVAGLFLILFGMESCTTRERWNSGHCDECGGEWVYEQAIGHQYSTTYLYHCKDCDNTIEIYERR